MQRITRDSWLATLMIVIVTVGMATSTDGGENATYVVSLLLYGKLASYYCVLYLTNARDDFSV